MRIGYLECFSGISGDMLLGALVDAGVPFSLLEETTQSLNVGARLELRKVMRGGLSATKVDVIAPGDHTHDNHHEQEHRHEHAHEHSHSHSHSHSHTEHEHRDDRSHEHDHPEHRAL